MKYDLPAYRGWSVFDIARGRKIEQVKMVDGDAQEIVVYDRPVQFNKATSAVVEHRFRFESLTLDNAQRAIYLMMSIGPADPTSGKTWHEWLKSDPLVAASAPTAPPPAAPKPHPAPFGVGRTQGQPPTAPPKGRE
jgi:hypothetical protein